MWVALSILLVLNLMVLFGVLNIDRLKGGVPPEGMSRDER